MGRPVYRNATSLIITADAGGSNGARLRLWKWELQQLANRTGLAITVCHFPPGTSNWNTIEHRLFSHIAMNWRAHPARRRSRDELRDRLAWSGCACVAPVHPVSEPQNLALLAVGLAGAGGLRAASKAIGRYYR